MCRMEAVISMEPLKTNALVGWLSDLALNRNQCDGWGFAAYLRSNLILYLREPTPIWERPPLHFPKADVAVVHARRASEGSITFLNSHPFVRVFQGKIWTFCHNGSVNKAMLQENLKAKPIGETDSEVLFLYVLESIEGLDKPEEILEALSEVGRELKGRKDELKISAVNFILTDGSALFALRGARLREDWFTLWLKDAETLPPRRPYKYSIVSSEPLPLGAKGWESLPNWTLIGRWFEGEELVKREVDI